MLNCLAIIWLAGNSQPPLRLQSEHKVSFSIGDSRKRKGYDSGIESEGEGDESEEIEESEEDLDFGHGGPDVVGFTSLQDAITALSRKFGAKFTDPAQIPKAPPLDDSKSFPPPNKS